MARTITPRGVLTREPDKRPVGRIVAAGAILGVLVVIAVSAASVIRTNGVNGITLRSVIAVYLPSPELAPVLIPVPTHNEYEFERVFGIERALASARSSGGESRILPSGGPFTATGEGEQDGANQPLQVEIMGLNDGLPYKAIR